MCRLYQANQPKRVSYTAYAWHMEHWWWGTAVRLKHQRTNIYCRCRLYEAHTLFPILTIHYDYIRCARQMLASREQQSLFGCRLCCGISNSTLHACRLYADAAASAAAVSASLSVHGCVAPAHTMPDNARMIDHTYIYTIPYHTIPYTATCTHHTARIQRSTPHSHTDYMRNLLFCSWAAVAVAVWNTCSYTIYIYISIYIYTCSVCCIYVQRTATYSFGRNNIFAVGRSTFKANGRISKTCALHDIGSFCRCAEQTLSCVRDDFSKRVAGRIDFSLSNTRSSKQKIRRVLYGVCVFCSFISEF